MLVILPSPILELQHTPLPTKCYELGSVPQLLTLLLFSPKTHIWIYQEVWEHVSSCTMGHWISFPIASLMQDAIKMSSSQITFFDQFHIIASYMETLSCFIYKMKCWRCCFRVNFEGPIVRMWWSLVNPNF
jgi:hypothetical protein